MSKLLYTLDEVGELTGFSRSSIYRLIRTDQLISIKACGRRLIPAQALERFVAEETRRSQEAAAGRR